MKVEIEKAASKEEEMALIKVCEMTDDIQSAVDILHNDCRTIPVMQGTETLFCGTEKIYYLESVDKHTYVYTKDCCYERYAAHSMSALLQGDDSQYPENKIRKGGAERTYDCGASERGADYHFQSLCERIKEKAGYLI